MRKTFNNRNLKDYGSDGYEDMKRSLKLSRALFEQATDKMLSLDDLNKPRLSDEPLEREEEKTREYTVSSGKVILHGIEEADLDLTDEEKNNYQETMDEFIEQVSDLVDYGPLKIYKNTVEWSGTLVKFDTEFWFSIGEKNGVYIIADMVKLDDDFSETLDKLRSYYQIFSSKWAKVIANRKATNVDKEEE